MIPSVTAKVVSSVSIAVVSIAADGSKFLDCESALETA